MTTKRRRRLSRIFPPISEGEIEKAADGSLFSKVLLAVATREKSDDLCACVVDAPKRRDARLDLWLHILGLAEVAAFEEGRANLFRFEETPKPFEERFRLGIRVTEEDIARRVAEFRVGVQCEMSLLEGEEDDEMTLFNHLRVDLQNVKARFLGETPQGGDGHLHVEQLVFFTVV